MRDKRPPVSEGQKLDVTIVSYGSKGDGIAKVEGYTLIVPDTQAERTYRVQVTKVMDTFGFAQVV